MSTSQSAPWEVRLRQGIRQDNGKGWSLRESRGRAQLVRIHEDRTRSSTKLELEWIAPNELGLRTAVKEIHDLMHRQNLGLAEAQARRLSNLGVKPTSSSSGPFDWQSCVDAFLQSRSNRRTKTLDDLQTRTRRVLEVMTGKPRPSNGGEVMRRYADAFFNRVHGPKHRLAGQLVTPPGGDGRRRNLATVASLLDYAVYERNAPARWRPLSTAKRAELIGSKPTTTDNNESTIPVLPEDLEDLLHAMLESGKNELWLATGLIAIFGLRLSELAVMRVDDDNELWIGGQVKRDLRVVQGAEGKAERLVKPLELKGQPGLGKRLVMLLKSGQIKLPKAIRNQIEWVEEKGTFAGVGAAYKQQLERFHYWQTLEKKHPGLSPYGLRHGWAWRSQKYSSRPLHYSQAAKLMGNSTKVFLQHYSSWVDRKELEFATDSFNAAIHENVAL